MPQLNAGDRAPVFERKDQRGELHSLDELRGGRLLLYFFPKADTRG
jgi:peroxiredoxin Q/BCP